MATRPKSTPSLQSLLDTYHYLVQGWQRTPATAAPRHADAVAWQLTLPAAVRSEMVATLRTIPLHLGVAGLSSASVRVNNNLWVMSDGMRPLAHHEETHLMLLALTPDGDDISSREGWHRWLYAHSEAQAIVMVHPAAAIRCATQGITPDPKDFPAGAQVVGGVRFVAPDPSTWATALVEGATLLVQDGTLIAYHRTLAGAIATADIVTRWCDVALHPPPP